MKLRQACAPETLTLSLTPTLNPNPNPKHNPVAGLRAPQGFDDADGNGCFKVMSAVTGPDRKQGSYTVRLFEFEKANYERVCSCGGCASSSVVCVHVKKVLRATHTRWQTFVKPWQQPLVWEKQIGLRWEPVEALEQVIAPLCPCVTVSPCDDAVTRCHTWSSHASHMLPPL